MIWEWSSVTVVLVFLSKHFQGWCAFNERQQNKARTEIWWVLQIYLHKRKIIRMNAILTKEWNPHAWNKASAFPCYCCLNRLSSLCLSSRSFLWKSFYIEQECKYIGLQVTLNKNCMSPGDICLFIYLLLRFILIHFSHLNSGEP